jgi:hypothetical protein
MYHYVKSVEGREAALAFGYEVRQGTTAIMHSQITRSQQRLGASGEPSWRSRWQAVGMRRDEPAGVILLRSVNDLGCWTAL